MHLLYLDESGHPNDPATEFFVLAGFSVFERSMHWLDSAITPIAARFNPACPSDIEFHGAPMRGGKEYWRDIAPADRVQAVVDVLALLGDQQMKLQVFASVIEKSTMPQDQILTKSFEHVASAFDQQLTNLWTRRKDPQRGLVIFDRTSYEEKLQALSSLFKHQGHSQGKLRNFCEVPLFLDSKASRLIQMADLIAYWIFRYFQSGDDRGFRLIEPYFHTDRRRAVGLITAVTPETNARLANLPAHAYPFPQPTAKAVAAIVPNAESVAAAEVTLETTTTTVTVVPRTGEAGV